MWSTFAALALIALQVPVAPPAPDPDARVRAASRIDLGALLEPIRARHDLPGLVGAIVDREGAVVVGACGVRERGREERLTVDDRMHLGSCTKSMTATSCAVLVERGRLKWTTTIGESFADWSDAVDPAWKPVTLAQLLSHRGGAPAQPDRALWTQLFTSKESPRAQREQLARGVLAQPPAYAPGTRFVYSNTGTSLAGMMAERAGTADEQRDFEDLLRAQVFVPLGMTTAGFGPPGSPDKLDEPRGHGADGKPVGLGVGSDNPPALTPAGRAHASIGDWAVYAALHLRGDELGGMGISRDTFARLHTPPDDGLDAYALGWMVLQRDWGGRVLTHSGSNTMWFCVAWLAPEKGFGVLVATNQGGDAAGKACDEAASAAIQAWTKRDAAK
jgi:CubicO group peptidase (beta-lactamase class C family)